MLAEHVVRIIISLILLDTVTILLLSLNQSFNRYNNHLIMAFMSLFCYVLKVVIRFMFDHLTIFKTWCSGRNKLSSCKTSLKHYSLFNVLKASQFNCFKICRGAQTNRVQIRITPVCATFRNWTFLKK